MTGSAQPTAAGLKAEMRRVLGARVGSLGRDERHEADSAICRALREVLRNGDFRVVLGHVALADEVCIDAFLAVALELGADVLLPRSEGTSLAWVAWRPVAVLQRDTNGVLAPCGAAVALGERRVLVVAPGRGFDRRGMRLGRGRGYYDRALSSLAGRAHVAGVAYDCQVVDRIPCEDHDRAVDLVLTEKERCAANAARRRQER